MAQFCRIFLIFAGYELFGASSSTCTASGDFDIYINKPTPVCKCKWFKYHRVEDY